MTIVLDPGHGGSDSGAINGKIYEKDINLKIANYLKKYLEEYENVKVIMTRGEMSSGKLEIFDRAMIARKNKADLLISLHINSSNSGSPEGVELYITNNTSLDKYKKNTSELGNIILKNISSLGIKNNGLKTRLIPKDETDVYSDGTRADYYGVIRYAMRGTMIDSGVTSILKNGEKVKVNASMSANVQNGEGIPTILIEHCYIKGNDVKYINNDASIKKLAEADGKGIVSYYKLTRKDATKSKIKGNKLFVRPEITLGKIKEQYTGKKVETKENQLPTGEKIKIDENEYTLVKMGDANGDGEVDAIDLLLTKRKILNTTKFNENQTLATDLNNDKEVDAIDLLLVKRFLLGTGQITIN